MAEIGIIGLGALGSAMALRLLEAGHSVTGHNRTRAKAEALQPAGLTVAKEVHGAAEADLVFSVLLNDDAVREVLVDAFPFSRRDTTHISISTIGLPLLQALAERHRAAGQAFVSAPVFGRPEAARAGQLLVICGGAEDAIARWRPVLEALGTVEAVGGDPAAANVAKMAGNFLMASAVQSLREAMALVGAAGVDREQFAGMIGGTLFPTPFYQRFAGTIAAQGSNAAAVNPFANSARLSGETAAALGVSAPVARTLADALRTSIA